MACKRTAANDLNHDNWNNEDEPEEAGTFVKAQQDVLDKRVVKVARRRLPARAADGPAKSAFGSFSGFKSTPAPAASPFSFLASAGKSESPSLTQSSKSGSNATATSNGAAKLPENGTEKPKITFPSMEPSSNSQESKPAENNEKGEENIFRKSSDYYAKLKGLNESVTQWIKSHVDSNPFCILTPIFRDYERYLKEIEENHGRDGAKSSLELPLEPPTATSSKLSSAVSVEKVTSDKPAEKKAEKSVFESNATKTTLSNVTGDWNSQNSIFGNSNPNAKSIFGNTSSADKSESKTLFGSAENNPFLSKTTEKKESGESSKLQTPSSGYLSFSQTNTTNTTATFSFGQSSATSTSPSAGFSFGSNKPLSFASLVAASKDSEAKAETEEKEDEDEPPKPDFKPITEEDAFYEKRCKVFVKKEGNFSDRGIGVLFLKSTPNGKTQLIVRADNSLGNLLINTLLTATIPTKRMNKNTVMLVCLPLPDSEPPPTPVLLRVKTSEDADSLIETLDNNKK